MSYQQAWNELMELIKVMKEFDLGDETESLILSIEYLKEEAGKKGEEKEKVAF
jgi:hypothetical protein